MKYWTIIAYFGLMAALAIILLWRRALIRRDISQAYGPSRYQAYFGKVKEHHLERYRPSNVYGPFLPGKNEPIILEGGLVRLLLLLIGAVLQAILTT